MSERPSPKEKVDLFMYNHGRKIATGATLIRVPGGVVVGSLILADMPKTAFGFHAFFK